MPYQKNTSIASDIPEDKTSDFQKIPIAMPEKPIDLSPADGSRNSLGQQTGGGAGQGFAG